MSMENVFSTLGTYYGQATHAFCSQFYAMLGMFIIDEFEFRDSDGNLQANHPQSISQVRFNLRSLYTASNYYA